jgi:hypothetical protein
MTAWFQTTFLGDYGGWFVANLILCLLIALPIMLSVALVIYGERKLWAEGRASGDDYSDGREPGPVPDRPGADLHGRADRMGGDPVSSRGDAGKYQCWLALHSRGVFARRVRRDHCGLGVQFQISLLFRASSGGADGVL